MPNATKIGGMVGSRWCRASKLFMLDTHNVCKVQIYSILSNGNGKLLLTLHAIESIACLAVVGDMAITILLQSVLQASKIEFFAYMLRCKLIYCDESIVFTDICIFVCGELAVWGQWWFAAAPSTGTVICFSVLQRRTHNNKIFPQSIWRLM